MKRAAVGALLLGAIAAGSGGPAVSVAVAGSSRCMGRWLPVVVNEGRAEVRLRIRVEERVDPDSVAVDLDGSRVRVAAREAGTGRRLCSGDLWLRAAVVEEESRADYADGWLTITLSRAPDGDDGK